MPEHHNSKLAKSAAQYFITTGNVLAAPRPMYLDLARQKACYVYMLENPGRRPLSMAGDVLPRQPNLALEIINHTVTAVKSCPKKLRKVDFPGLAFNILVLEPLQKISDLAQLNPARFGLYLRGDQNHRTIILPGRPGIDTADDQVATAIREAGIDLRKEAISLYRFGAELF